MSDQNYNVKEDCFKIVQYIHRTRFLVMMCEGEEIRQLETMEWNRGIFLLNFFLDKMPR